MIIPSHYTLVVSPLPATPLQSLAEVLVALNCNGTYYVIVHIDDCVNPSPPYHTNVVVRLNRSCAITVTVYSSAMVQLETHTYQYTVLNAIPVLTIDNYGSKTSFDLSTEVTFRSTKSGTLTYSILNKLGIEIFVSDPLSVITSDGSSYIAGSVVTISDTCLLLAELVTPDGTHTSESFRFEKIAEGIESAFASEEVIDDVLLSAGYNIGWARAGRTLYAGDVQGVLQQRLPPRLAVCGLDTGIYCVEGWLRFKITLFNTDAAPFSHLYVEVNNVVQAEYVEPGGHWFEMLVPAGPLSLRLWFVSQESPVLYKDYVMVEAIELPELRDNTDLPSFDVSVSGLTAVPGQAIIRVYNAQNAIGIADGTEPTALNVLSVDEENGTFYLSKLYDAEVALWVRSLGPLDKPFASRLVRISVESGVTSAPASATEDWQQDFFKFCWAPVEPSVVGGTWMLYDGKLRSPAISQRLTELASAPLQLETGNLTVSYAVHFDVASGPSSDLAWLKVGQQCLYLNLSTAGNKTLVVTLSAAVETVVLGFWRDSGSSLDQYVDILQIDLPYVPATSTLIVLPESGPTTFPCEVTMSTSVLNASILYTLDGTVPSLVDNNYSTYTVPVSLAAMTVMKVAVLKDGELSALCSRFYLDDLKTPKALAVESTTQLILAAFPDCLPILYRSSIDDFESVKLYTGTPVELFSTQTILMCTPSLTDLQIGLFIRGLQSMSDLFDWTKATKHQYVVSHHGYAFETTYCVYREIFSYPLSVVPSRPSGTYLNEVNLTLRSNMSEAQILYTLDSSDPESGTIYENNQIITITTNVVLRCMAVLDSIHGPKLQYDYSISSTAYDGISGTVLKLNSVESVVCGCSLTLFKVNKTVTGAILACAVNMYTLTDTIRQTAYTQYQNYVLSSGIYALFADLDKQYPFPFVFTVTVSTGSTFRVPDTASAIYMNGRRVTDFTQDALVCQFDNVIGDNTVVTVVSDFCLRLCIDTSRTPITDSVIQVWTNVPVNTYLMSSSDSVKLSNDGITFSKFICLSSDTLYVKGHMDLPTYGNNIFGVDIKLLDCEASYVS